MRSRTTGLESVAPVGPPWGIAIVSGSVLGLVAALVAQGLRPSQAPLATLLVLGSALVTGRLANLGPALAHGACAWAMLVALADPSQRPVEAWHSVPAALVVFILIADMVVLGHLGRVRRLDR